MPFRHVSPLTASSGSTTDTFRQQGQQNDLPNVKFNLTVCDMLARLLCDMLHNSCANILNTAKLNFTAGKSFC